ncbi:MAG: hypothetical protein ACI4SR_05595 [Faecalibacillus sp.]
MNFIKKIAKEISVFGLVFVVFIALYAYRQVTHVEITTISQTKLEEKMKAKDSFIVVMGSDNDSTTLSYKETCLKYLEKNHSDTIYYVDLSNEDNPTTYIQKQLKTDDGSIPSTFVIKNGKVAKQKSGSLSYYRIAELFK